MQVRNVILGALGVVVLVGFAMLIMDSQGGGSASVNEDEVEKALQSYQRKVSKEARDAREVRTTIPASLPRKSEEPKAPVVVPTPVEENDIFVAKAGLSSQANDATRIYDRANYEGARNAAVDVLASDPSNVRMKRIVVSSSCIMGDEDLAVQYYGSLPAHDQRQMARRCKRYGIEFEEAQ